MATTKIEWADRTWNPITGCTKISEGCANCYAERMSKRLAGRCGYDKENPFSITYHENRIHEPANWNYNKHEFVFCGSMGDMFHQDVTDEMLDNVFSTMAIFPEKTFLVLTKRPERMQQYFSVGKDELIDRWDEAIYRVGWETESARGDVDSVAAFMYNTIQSNWPAKNIWLGVTAENQEQADKRIPILLNIPAAKHFVSIEPMLSHLDLAQASACAKLPLDWVICGGETGSKARAINPDWVRSLRDQCEAANVPFFFKGWGEWHIVEKNYIAGFVKVGKKASGDLLTGKQYHNRPNK